MKNWISWIIGGALTVSATSYVAFRDPLLDLLQSSHSIEQFWYTNTVYENPSDNSDADESEPRDGGKKSTFVQQSGSSRFTRSAQTESRSFQRNHYSTLRAFQECVGDNWKSTVQILEKGRQIALGAIVDSDGWIVTKGSEVPDHVIEIRLQDGSRAEGMVKKRRSDLDLALIKIERSNLTAIRWNTNVDVSIGAWLVSTDVRRLPIAIGVLSVANRNVPSEKAVLGVKLEDPPSNSKGALVANVVEGSGADRAGVRSGDIIYGINGDLLSTTDEVFKRLQGLQAGQRVDVVVIREGSSDTKLTAQMMDLNQALLTDPTEMEVNGEISARATGFSRVIQHDSVISPHQCGGPIVDIHGNAVGLNIARAGRVASYAVPAKVVAPAVSAMLAEVTGNQAPNSIAKASAMAPVAPATLPASVPSGIVIESLKPEVLLPK
jgi:serine protease Do